MASTLKKNKTLQEILKRPLRIGYFCNYLNEVDGIQHHVDTMGKIPFDARIYVDGKFPDFQAEYNYSTDGSNEIIKSMPNTHLISGGDITEMEKNNLAFELAGKLDLDFLIQCDADEWMEFDKTIFEESFNQEMHSTNTFQYMIRFTNHFSSPPRIINFLPRLFFKPGFIRCENIHWWFYAFGNRITVDPSLFIDGIHMYHDDRVRSVSRNDLMNKYQEINIKRERGIMKTQAGQMFTEITSHKCEFNPLYERGTRCYICERDISR